MKDYYKILKIPRNASFSEIDSIYRKLSKIYHPDPYEFDKKHASEEFLEIKEAYEILSNPIKREKYDKDLNFLLELSQKSLDFGSLSLGTQKCKRFQVIWKSSDVSSISFETSKPDNWFRIDPLWNNNFPLDVDVYVNTDELDENQYYEGWIEINIDGYVSKIQITLNTKSSKESARIFTFKSGESISRPEDIPNFCDKYWNEIRDYLYDDKYLKNWFIELRRNDLVAKLEEVRLEKNKNIGLDKFIRLIEPQMNYPTLEMEVVNNNFLNYVESDYFQEAKVVIKNAGPGWSYGKNEIIDATWLKLLQNEFVLPPGEVIYIRLTPISYEVMKHGKYTATLHITTNSINHANEYIKFNYLAK